MSRFRRITLDASRVCSLRWKLLGSPEINKAMILLLLQEEQRMWSLEARPATGV